MARRRIKLTSLLIGASSGPFVFKWAGLPPSDTPHNLVAYILVTTCYVLGSARLIENATNGITRLFLQRKAI